MYEKPDPIPFASHYDEREAYIRDVALPHEAIASRHYWNDVHHAKSYLDFTITLDNIASGKLTSKILTDFSLPAIVDHQHLSSTQRAVLAMRKHVRGIINNLEYAPAMSGETTNDVYADLFEHAKGFLEQARRGRSQQAQALEVIRRLHRLSTSDPRVNNHVNPYIPAAVNTITGQRSDHAASK